MAAVCLSFLALTASGTQAASDTREGLAGPDLVAAEQRLDDPAQPLPEYSSASDHELTRMGARWDELSKAEKDALLKEVKLRMAQRKDTDGVLMIRTQRRYGRVYGGGQYLKIETKVVRIAPADGSRGTTSGFGVGFEQRTAGDSQVVDEDRTQVLDPEVEDAPVVRVTDRSQ